MKLSSRFAIVFGLIVAAIASETVAALVFVGDPVETRFWSVAAAVAALAITFLAWRLVVRRITGPATVVETAIRRLPAGELWARAGGRFAQGELGGLADAIDELATELQTNEAARRALDANLPSTFVYQVRHDPKDGPRYVSISPSVQRIIGVDADVLLREPALLDALILTEDMPKLVEARRQTVLAGVPMNLDFRARHPDGEVRQFHVVSAPRRLADGTILSDGIVTDVTERRRTERELAATARALRTSTRCRHAVVHAVSEPELLQEICDSIAEEGGYRLCWVAYREDDESCSVKGQARAGASGAFLLGVSMTWADTERGRGPIGAVLRTGDVQVVDDVESDPGYAPWVEQAREHGVRSVLAMPLKESGRTFGALGIYSAEPGPWDANELALLGELAADLEYGIGVLRARARHEQSTEQLLVSQERFRLAWEQSPIGVTITDTAGNWLEVNAAMCAITGYSREEMLGRNFRDITHPDDLAADLAQFARLLAGEILNFRMPKRYIRKDGRVIWVEIHVSIIRGLRGAPVECVAEIVDITARREAEEQFHLSRTKMKLALEMGGLVYYEADFATELIHFEAGIREILGLDDGEPGGLAITAADFAERFLFPEDREAVISDAANILAGRPVADRLSLVLRFRRVGGAVGRLTILRLLDRVEPGGRIRVRGAVQDVTDRETLREQLAQAQKMEAVGQLAGGIAHDFNNLITVILGYCQMLVRSFDDKDRRRAMAEEILKAAERSAALTAQLLAFSRKEVLAPRILDVNEMVRDTGKMLTRLLGEDVELSISLGAGLSGVWGDSGQLQQVLINLVVNARDAMPGGGRIAIDTAPLALAEPRTSCHASIPPGRYVRLGVRDTGTGIPESVQQHMFDPFYTTKGPGKGTGLGLAVVYGVVRQCGGFLEVESEMGKGSTFLLYFPCREGLADSASGEASRDGMPRGTETLLVVEDEPSILELASDVLEQQGYVVIGARDGAEALALFEECGKRVDMLLTDVVMPNLGGGELASRLRAKSPRLRILFVSGYADDDVVRQGVYRDEVELLQKPYSISALACKVREVLDRP